MDQAAEPAGAAQREAEFDRFVNANLKRNYIATFLNGMLGMTGFRLIMAPTFLPTYIFAISGSNAIVGLAQGLQQFGGVIAPIIGASRVEHRKRVLPAVMLTGWINRFCIIAIAIAGWLLHGPALVFALLAILFCFGFTIGAGRVVNQVLLSKVTPIRLRGRLQAYRNMVGGAIAAVLAYFAGKYFLEHNTFGNGYSTTFLLAFVLTSLGISAIALLQREPDSPSERAAVRLRDRLRSMPAQLAAAPHFRNFLGAQMLCVGARVAAPFYVLYASSKMHVGGETLGLLSLAFLGADTISNLPWGSIGDRFGFRMVMLGAVAVWIAGLIALLAAHDTPSLALAFFLLGAAGSGYMLSASTIVLEFGARDEIPMRLGLSTTAEGIVACLGPPLGGLLATAMGYQALFAVALMFLALSLAMLIWLVKEPRNLALPR
ncbi:MAG: MFS transporter [Hyphomonadaceae bacterium]